MTFRDRGFLPLQQPYDFEISTDRFRAFGPDLANLWHEGGLHRVIDSREVRIEAAQGGVEVEPAGRDIALEVLTLLGAPFDLVEFYEFARGDAVLARLTREVRGFRPPLAPDPFESLVTSISAQQVSLFAAFAIRNRLIARYGEPGQIAIEFPTRVAIAAAEPAEVVELGFSQRKAQYVVGLARNEIDLDGLRQLSDEEVRERLVAVRGLGDWTSDWFLARHLARPRAWPAGDLGLSKAVSTFYFGGARLTTKEVREFGARFDPFQNLAAHYLLMGLRVPRGK